MVIYNYYYQFKRMKGENNMQLSKYNFIYTNILEENNNAVIYNSRTGALAVLEPEYYDKFSDLLKSGKTIEDEEFVLQLSNCGYIINDDTINEIDLVKSSLLSARYNSSNLMLTIAPTMSCNFRCVYCFEKGQNHNERMTEETAENIVQFVKERASHLDTLSITWFGGEPLLAINHIKNISTKIIDICKEYKIDYRSSIITNGYQLDVKTAEILKECCVGNIQITIDGPKEIHDKRRPLANGKGTFDVIMNNILKVKGILPIVIRINTDYENWKELNDIVNFLKKNMDMKDVTVYLGLVTPSNDNYEGDKCMTDEIYSMFNLQFMKANEIPLTNIYPAPKGNYCTADHANSWVIDTYGHLYKCWSDIGIIEKSLGCINNNNTSMPPNVALLNSYMLYDPTEDERCRECKYLPLCLGGCPYNRLSNLSICAQYKYNLDEYLKECTKILLEQQKVSI